MDTYSSIAVHMDVTKPLQGSAAYMQVLSCGPLSSIAKGKDMTNPLQAPLQLLYMAFDLATADVLLWCALHPLSSPCQA